MRKCPFCAEEIQDAAIVCKHCGRDLKLAPAAGTVAPPAVPGKPPRHPLKTLLIAFVIAASLGVGAITLLVVMFLVAGTGGSSGSTAGSRNETSRSESVVTVSAAEIVGAYKANEVAADQRFKDRTIDILGEIESIGRDILDNPYVTLSAYPVDSVRTVQAVFPREAEPALASLQKGRQITVRCRGRGLLMNVQMDRCSIR